MRLRRAREEGRLDREMSQIARARLLVIDELGFLPLDADGARLVFQVFADAYERQSVVITTNLEFSRWGGVCLVKSCFRKRARLFFRVSSRKFFGFRRGHAANFLTCPA